MKKYLILLALLAAPFTHADTNDVLKTSVVSFTQLSISNRSITIAAYPTYAPQIVIDGKKDNFGVGMELLTPVALVPGLADSAIAQHTFVGVRFDYLAHQAFASTVGLGMKGDMQLWGHTFTGFTQASANIPFSGFGVQNGQLGAAVGGGVYTTIWTFTHGSLGFESSAEKWTQFQGEVFHAGPVLTLSF